MPRENVGDFLRCHLHDTLHDRRTTPNLARDAEDAQAGSAKLADACLNIGPDFGTAEPFALSFCARHT
jgi:hypothetical protein